MLQFVISIVLYYTKTTIKLMLYFYFNLFMVLTMICHLIWLVIVTWIYKTIFSLWINIKIFLIFCQYEQPIFDAIRSNNILNYGINYLTLLNCGFKSRVVPASKPGKWLQILLSSVQVLMTRTEILLPFFSLLWL